MSTKTPKTILFGTPIGAVAGAAAGYFLPSQMLELSFLGQFFINVLWIVAVPLILTAVAVGIGTIGDGQRIRRTIGSGLLYFVGTTAIAILIGVAVAGLMGPGVGIEADGGPPPQQAVQAQQVTVNGLMNTLVPRSLVQAAASGEYFVIILAALFFGAVLATMGRRRRLVLDVFRSISEVLQKLIRWVMWAAPIGVFFLTATLFANQPELVANVTGNMGMFLLAMLVGLALHALIVLPLLLRYFGNRPPLEYFSKLVPALASAFGTGSAIATLPVTHQCVAGDSRVDNRAAALMLPLGATINIGGTVMFVMMAAMFVSQMMPGQVSVLQLATIAVGALVMSLAMASATNIPGIPGAGLLILAILFRVAGLPEAAFGALALVAGVEWLLHRACTAVNVWSDAVGASVIAVKVNAQSPRRSVPERSSRSTIDRKRPITRDDSHRDRRDQSRSGRGSRPGDRPERRQPPSRGRREAPKLPQADLHRAKDTSSPFALKQDNVVDLGATPEKRTTRDEAPQRSGGRPTPDTGRTRPSGPRPSGQRPSGPSDRPPRGRSRRPDDARNTDQRSSDRDSRGTQDRPSRDRSSRDRQQQDRPQRDRHEEHREERQPRESRPPRTRPHDKHRETVDKGTVDRERSRVETQLADMKRKEQTRPIVSPSPTPEPVMKEVKEPREPRPTPEVKAPPEVKTPPEVKKDASAPVIDYSSPDMAAAPAPEKPKPAPVAPVEPPVRSESKPPSPPPVKKEPTPDVTADAKSDSAKEKPAVTFGRSRRTGGQKPKDSKEKSPSTKSPDTTDKKSNVEKVPLQATSFGRAKKKRVRR
jgi:Na+/H+-dicarboxylate symporter